MLASLVCSLIKHRRITTTLAKAKAARSVAEKMVTLAKDGSVHHRVWPPPASTRTRRPSRSCSARLPPATKTVRGYTASSS